SRRVNRRLGPRDVEVPGAVDGDRREVLTIVDRAVARLVQRRVDDRLARAGAGLVVGLAERDAGDRRRRAVRIALREGVDDDRIRVAVRVPAAEELPLRVREGGVDDVHRPGVLVHDDAADDPVRLYLLRGKRRVDLRLRLRAGRRGQLEHVRAGLAEAALVRVALLDLVDRHVLAAGRERIALHRDPR